MENSPGLTPGIGLYPGIPASDYHRMPYASQSKLKIMRGRTPAHVRYEIDHPKPPTPEQELGQAVHDCVLLPDFFAAKYSLSEPCEGMTKQGKRCSRPGTSRWEGVWCCHQHVPKEGHRDDVTVLSREDWDACMGIRNSLNSRSTTKALLDGPTEQTAIWQDPDVDILCRGRFDVIVKKHGVIPDLKTTRSADAEGFQRDMFNFGYHMQGWFYLRGTAALGIDCDTFAIIAAEKEPPYEAAVYELSPYAIDDGGRELMPLLERYAECEHTGEWPGYPDEIRVIDLATWAPRKIDERLGAIA